MPKARAQLVCVDATPYYHCISRCVRRAFLCGDDPVSGGNFEHRKAWLADRMLELSAVFAIDVCAYAMLSNHFHLVLRVDRERALAWTDDEVERRMETLFPAAVAAARNLPEAARKQRIAEWRSRTWSLSWYMRCLNEAIARRANREDGCTGRFWEGRFKSQALLDVGGLLTCMAYVDLNPIRAGMATSLEDSEFTSIRQRLCEAARAPEAVYPTVEPSAGSAVPRTADKALGRRAPLLPFADELDGHAYWRNLGNYEPATPLNLPIERADYIELLRCTAGLVDAAPDPPLPAPLVPLLDSLGLAPAGFVRAVREFSRSFFTMVGEVHRIDLECARRGYRRRPGRSAARRLYLARSA